MNDASFITPPIHDQNPDNTQYVTPFYYQL